MARISIEQAQPGQVVIAPIMRPPGITLLKAPAVLTAEIIHRLQQMGVADVSVRADPSAVADATSRDERLAQLDALFEGHEADELMMSLKELVASQLD